MAFAMLAAIEAFVRWLEIPSFMLPPPMAVFRALYEQGGWLLQDAVITLTEIILGLALATLLGCAFALVLAFKPRLHGWVWPWLVISQAIPVFALAPLLVLWLGYGMASKIAMACIIILFPITAAFYDGLRRTNPAWIDQAHIMAGTNVRARRRILLYVRLPAALPALASGLRIGAGVAPIGAIIGEWVGASAGLGYAMMQANARMQIDVMFAALALLALMGLALYFGMDQLMRRLVFWNRETL